MKRFLFVVVVGISCTLAKAQILNVSAGIEKTAVRCLYGGELTFETKRKWGLGLFYQTAFLQETKEVRDSDDTFYGLLSQVPLAKTETIDFFATARLGMVSGSYFVAVPGLETRIKTWRKLSTILSMGYRVGYPAIGLKLSHSIF
jgi:hypothetical protein